jgi:hypothetical protein
MNARHSLPSGERSPRRRLLAIDFATADLATVGEAISTLLEETTLSNEDRVQLLGNALVMEALRPFWVDGRSPGEAHRMLRGADPELADAVESLAPMLLSRAEARDVAERAVAEAEALLGAV